MPYSDEKIHFHESVAPEEQEAFLRNMQEIGTMSNDEKLKKNSPFGGLKKLACAAAITTGIVFGAANMTTISDSISDSMSSKRAMFGSVYDISVVRNGAHCPVSRKECVKMAEKYYDSLPDDLYQDEKEQEAIDWLIRQIDTWDTVHKEKLDTPVANENRIGIILDSIHKVNVRDGSICDDPTACRKKYLGIFRASSEDTLTKRETDVISQSIIDHNFNNPKMKAVRE